jgi:hypothetical protein
MASKGKHQSILNEFCCQLNKKIINPIQPYWQSMDDYIILLEIRNRAGKKSKQSKTYGHIELWFTSVFDLPCLPGKQANH